MIATVENKVEIVRKTVKGAELNNFVSLPATLRNIQVEIIVLPAVTDKPKQKPAVWNGPPMPDSFFEALPSDNPYSRKPTDNNTKKKNGNALNIGCFPNLPDVPDSFFEPLPEEDLRAWGL